jgi:hypothetical protein
VPLGKRLTKPLAIALILWWAGAGCLIVSYARVATMSSTGAEAAESADASTGMASHESCHAARKKNNSKAANAKPEVANGSAKISLPTPARSDAMNCCPLTSRSIVAASRVQGLDDYKSAPAADAANDLRLSLLSSAPLDVPLRLPNQNHLYLRGCAFLI